MKSNSSLYFIALVPPDPVFSEVAGFKQYMSDRYSTVAALRSPPHITLHMPFQWNENKEERLVNSLRCFAGKESVLNVSLDGFGSFAPKVIYVRVGANDALMELQARLFDHVRVGLSVFNANYRQLPFHPHLTVAFRDLKRNIFPLAWKEFEGKDYRATFSADQICLLKHNSKKWEVYKEFSLNP